jgi:hypothetical protein
MLGICGSPTPAAECSMSERLCQTSGMPIWMSNGRVCVEGRMRIKSYTLSALAFFAFGDSALTAELPLSHGCLYAVSVGPNATPILPCEDKDPLDLSNNLNILNIINALGLNRASIKFKGCRNHPFLVRDYGIGPSGGRQYTIYYPDDPQVVDERYIAPITHELAHVWQMEVAGGINALEKEIPQSKRVELGADHLMGYIYAKILRHMKINEFQNNMSLIGAYVELDEEAHGTPSQRTNAFRRGVFLPSDRSKRDIRIVNDDFQANGYADIIHFD